jgi:prefoldin subunit 5
MLSEQAEFLEAELEQIQQRLKELRETGKEKKNAEQT